MRQTKPAYLSLYETLRDEILSGVRPYGSRLPSRRVLARDRGVSSVTVDHSYELLCEEGYTESRPKSGFYVIYREEDGFSLPARNTEPVSLSPVAPGSRDSFPFPSIARVMRRVLSDYGEQILVRPPNTGCPELRDALCRYLARNRGIRVLPDQLVIGAGAEYLYATGASKPPRMKKSSRFIDPAASGLISVRWGRTEFCRMSFEALLPPCCILPPSAVFQAASPLLFPSAVNIFAGSPPGIDFWWRTTMNRSFPFSASRKKRSSPWRKAGM